MKKTDNNERKVSKGRVIDAYETLASAKRSKMEADDRRAIHKILWPMKKVADDFAGYRKEAVRNLQPENYDSIVGRINRFNAMTEAEREKALTQKEYVDALRANLEFNNEITKTLDEERAKEMELDFEPLAEEAYDRLLDSNPDWDLGTDIELRDILCKGK